MQLVLVISSLAVLVAFAALWMSASAIKKGEHDLAEFGNAMRHDFGGLRGRVEAKLAEIETRVSRAEQQAKQAQGAEAKTQEMIKEINDDVAVLRDAITDIETSIPPQYRRHKHMADQDRV